MTPLSRWSLDSQEQDKIKELFLVELVRINDGTRMESLLRSLLSESEFLMVAKRLVAFVMVEEGRTDVEIGKMLHVTRATANRFRLAYLRAKDKQAPVVKIVNEARNNAVMRRLLMDLAKYVIRAIGGRGPKRGLL